MIQPLLPPQLMMEIILRFCEEQPLWFYGILTILSVGFLALGMFVVSQVRKPIAITKKL